VIFIGKGLCGCIWVGFFVKPEEDPEGFADFVLEYPIIEEVPNSTRIGYPINCRYGVRQVEPLCSQ